MLLLLSITSTIERHTKIHCNADILIYKMTRLFKNVKLLNLFKVPVRYKNPSHHWSVLKKKKPSTKKALDHFDDFYEPIYGSSWKNIRSALLDDNHKYVAIVNNFSDSERICQELEGLGAMNIKQIYNACKENMEYQRDIQQKQKLVEETDELDKNLDRIVSEKQMEHSIYPNPFDTPPNPNSKDNDENHFKPVKLQSIEANVTVQSDENRIIMASQGLSASQLYEYIPATKLKGMDDYMLESEHYSYYTKGADFSIRVENESILNFPDNLLIYTFEENNFTKFPKPKNGSTALLDYYVLDGASILPVLALDLQPGDTFLDMCAAPGGKTLTAMQSMNPTLVVANDVQESRINRINKFVNEFFGDIGDWDKRFFITQSDARYIQDNDIYNKILVDVPCTTDRHVVHEDDNNIFKSSRLKERLRLPELQTELLLNALKLVRIGGTVVYSTCSLSPIQNDGVVQLALKKAFEEFNIVAITKDQTQALSPLKYLYNIGGFGLKYGHIVYPTKSRNWGPIYFCKIVRVQ